MIIFEIKIGIEFCLRAKSPTHSQIQRSWPALYDIWLEENGYVEIGMDHFAFAQNEKTVEGYLNRINNNEWAHFKGHLLSDEEKNLHEHITKLMCHFKTEWSFGDPIEEQIKIQHDGLKEMEGDGLL